MTKQERSVRMRLATNYAEYQESNSGHQFFGEIAKNLKPSPRLSTAGQFYFDCLKCGRSLFEGNTGSANGSNCQ